MTSAHQKQEKAVHDLARTLVISEFHCTTFSSRMERVLKGKTRSFPCVIIDPTTDGIMDEYHLFSKHKAKKEWETINRLINTAKLPVLRAGPLREGHLELMSITDASVNHLIGEIKSEIEAIDARAAKKRKA